MQITKTYLSSFKLSNSTFIKTAKTSNVTVHMASQLNQRDKHADKQPIISFDSVNQHLISPLADNQSHIEVYIYQT